MLPLVTNWITEELSFRIRAEERGFIFCLQGLVPPLVQVPYRLQDFSVE